MLIKKLSALLLVILLISPVFASSTGMKTGMAVGYNTSNYVPVNNYHKNIPGFRMGGFAQMPLGKSLFQAELLLASKGFLAESIGDTRLTNLFLYVELPLSIKYEFLPKDTWNIYLLGGFSVGLKIIAINLVTDFDGIRSFDAGVHIGFGARYKKVEFEARFDQSILNFDLIEANKFHQTLSLGMNFYFRGK